MKPKNLFKGALILALSITVLTPKSASAAEVENEVLGLETVENEVLEHETVEMAVAMEAVDTLEEADKKESIDAIEQDFATELNKAKKIARDKVYEKESFLTAHSINELIARIDNSTSIENINSIIGEISSREKENEKYYALLEKMKSAEAKVNSMENLNDNQKKELADRIYSSKSEVDINAIINEALYIKNNSSQNENINKEDKNSLEKNEENKKQEDIEKAEENKVSNNDVAKEGQNLEKVDKNDTNTLTQNNKNDTNLKKDEAKKEEKNKAKNKNSSNQPKTGINSMLPSLALLISSSGGLFISKNKK